MRSLLLASAATFALMLAQPGLAQTTQLPAGQLHAPGQANPAPTDTAAPVKPTVPAEMQGRPVHHDQMAATSAASSPDVMIPGHEPLSRVASNIDAADTHSTIAPRLPSPGVGLNATPMQLLHAARDALSRKATGQAQEALERAETALLDRSTPPSNANVPDSTDAVKLIAEARQALGHHDIAQATQAVDSALKTPSVMHGMSNS